MKTVWEIARYEFKIQHRSLAFWLVALVLSAFLYIEVLQGISNDAGLASGQNSFLAELFGAEAQETMNVTSFSLFQAWGISDLLGLMSALIISVLSAFVWQRDRRFLLTERLNTLPIQSWQYVLGKYLGVVFSWIVIVLPLATVAILWTLQEANRFGLPFLLKDFPIPLTVWMLVSLLYGTAFVMLISLVVRNGAGTLLIYFLYWNYCLTDVRMLQGASTAKLFSYWLIRSGYQISRDNLHVVQERIPVLMLNRLFYFSITIMLIWLMIWIFNRYRQQGTLLGLGGDAG